MRKLLSACSDFDWFRQEMIGDIVSERNYHVSIFFSKIRKRRVINLSNTKIFSLSTTISSCVFNALLIYVIVVNQVKHVSLWIYCGVRQSPSLTDRALSLVVNVIFPCGRVHYSDTYCYDSGLMFLRLVSQIRIRKDTWLSLVSSVFLFVSCKCLKFTDFSQVSILLF